MRPLSLRKGDHPLLWLFLSRVKSRRHISVIIPRGNCCLNCSFHPEFSLQCQAWQVKKEKFTSKRSITSCHSVRFNKNVSIRPDLVRNEKQSFHSLNSPRYHLLFHEVHKRLKEFYVCSVFQWSGVWPFKGDHKRIENFNMKCKSNDLGAKHYKKKQTKKNKTKQKTIHLESIFQKT